MVARFALLMLLAWVSSFQASFAGELLGGFASKDITPEVGVPLGGYGGKGRRASPFKADGNRDATFFAPSTGVLDPIEAKVLALQNGDRRLLVVAVDFIGMTSAFRKDLIARVSDLGFTDENVIVSATHTHSGPGAIVHNLFWELVAMDLFRARVYERLQAQIEEAVREAVKSLQPVQVFSTSFEAEGLQKNRRWHSDHVDHQARLLLVKTQEGKWLGGIVNFAIHGTSLNADNHLFSSDAPGAIRREMENLLAKKNRALVSAEAESVSRQPVVLLINGVEGDVSPAGEGADRMLWIGQDFARQAEPALEALVPVETEWTISSIEVKLPVPKFRIEHCSKAHAPALPLGFFFPRKTRIWQVRLGELNWLTWPGEPTTEVGEELRKRVPGQSWIFGLTNDHLAYFTSESEFNGVHTETCSSPYGPRGSRAILDAHENLFSGKTER